MTGTPTDDQPSSSPRSRSTATAAAGSFGLDRGNCSRKSRPTCAWLAATGRTRSARQMALSSNLRMESLRQVCRLGRY